ncbi:helix-turn-helix domain-containing protein [Niabella ginsengisoli]|uniref:Helix-turn-helix domain-containing protein n=1 Tax=Niabella ginsengisoli TaxID=522298 RepID=A0ABS9SM95_9BACT|nr:helix-turn-helix transcriptional regulator [Niabella ginsengisoli]MCH5599503.1 helix-turn-helix domain-containing protein [Niabella ginsengisoli]
MSNYIDDELLAFGQRLRQLRKYRNLTQVDLEISSGVGNADISRIENGQKNIEIITVIKFAKALKIATKDLFDYTGDLPE